MLFKNAHEKMMQATENMREKAEDGIFQAQYKAAIEIYSEALKNNREEAAAFLKSHREEQSVIFSQAMNIIDCGIDYRNPALVKSALELIKTARKYEPEFFSKYYDKRFGR